MLAIKRVLFFLPCHQLNSLFICILLSSPLSGCSSDTPSPIFQVPGIVRYETEAQYIPQKRKRYDLEEDGLPSQLPPSIRIHSLPDDPAQPWSVNYGREKVGNSSLGDESQDLNISDEEKTNSSRQ